MGEALQAGQDLHEEGEALQEQEGGEAGERLARQRCDKWKAASQKASIHPRGQEC